MTRLGRLLLASSLLAGPLSSTGGTRAASNEAERGRWGLDDFDDGDLVSASGLGWLWLSDAMIGGSSTLELSTAAEAGRGRYLRLRGRTGADGFAGAWVGLDGGGRAVDLAAFDGIALRLRGAGQWQVGVRAAVGEQFVNYVAPVAGAAEWREARVAFSQLRPDGKAATDGAAGPDLRQARWLGVQSPRGRAGAIELDVDDVALFSNRVAQPRPGPAGGPSMEVRVPRASPGEVAGAAWQRLAADEAGDGVKPALPDALSLSSWDDAAHGTVWFRIEVAQPLGDSFGANLAVDLDGDPGDGMAWWGKNTAFKFDRLVSAWVYGGDDRAVQGLIGIADAATVSTGAMMDPGLAVPRVAVEPGGRALLLGVPRSVLEAAGPVRLLAAVGSARQHNDDIPGQGAAVLTLK